MKIKQRIFELIVLLVVGFICLMGYKILTANQWIVEPGYRYGQNQDVCYEYCDTSRYNECIGEEGEAMLRCIADKTQESNIEKDHRNLVY